MEKIPFEKFEALLIEWKNAVESSTNISALGIDTEEFLEPFYVVIEEFAKLVFEEKIDAVYDYVYDMSDLSIKELYNLVYEV